jgi:peptidoglycan/LPS O-acetylase OafA/YrhL
MGENDREAIRRGQNQLTIIFSFVFGALITVYYLFSFDVMAILTEKHLWLCAGITIVSLLFLAVAGKAVSKWTNSEAVRRKIFHVGPILCLPIIHHLNQELLPLILVAAFAALLLLEVIRYHQQLLQEESMQG